MIEKKRIININDLFADEDSILESSDTGIKEIYLYKLIPFRNHPFKLYEGQRLEDMVESIKEHGVITPIIVRPIPMQEEQYEILSGHNRANAAKIVGLEKIPAVIKEGLTDEEAMLIVTETNLIQRSLSELSHSEKARIITERHNAIKSQGKKMDIINEIEIMSNTDGYAENSTFVQFERKHDSREKVAGSYDLSPSAVARLLRIDMLINELKIRLDNKDEIPFMAGVDLSYLSKDDQGNVENLLDKYGYKIDIKKSSELKRLSKNRNLTFDNMKDILSDQYFKKKKIKNTPKLSASFNKKLIGKFEDGEMGIKEIEELILKLVDKYLETDKITKDELDF